MKEYEQYDWNQLTPLFWSEISSSYMIRNIFERHKEVAREFLQKFLGLAAVRIKLENLQVMREKNYPGKAHIDVFLSVADDFCVLVEVKVHDYASARQNQLAKYYQAALDNQTVDEFKDVFLIYLTQYNAANFKMAKEYAIPASLEEFAATQRRFDKHANKMRHINWEEFHAFLGGHLEDLTKEEKLIIALHRQWIEGKSEDDKERHRDMNGQRGLEYYFPDIVIDLTEKLPFGKKDENNLFIDLKDSTAEQRNQVIETIELYLESRAINRVKAGKKEYAIEAAKNLIVTLQQNEAHRNLLPFYKRLFALADSRQYLQLEGTGSRGFSIMVDIQGKGKLSLCTIWTNKHKVEFKLKR